MFPAYIGSYTAPLGLEQFQSKFELIQNNKQEMVWRRFKVTGHPGHFIADQNLPNGMSQLGRDCAKAEVFVWVPTSGPWIEITYKRDRFQIAGLVMAWLRLVIFAGSALIVDVRMILGWNPTGSEAISWVVVSNVIAVMLGSMMVCRLVLYRFPIEFEDMLVTYFDLKVVVSARPETKVDRASLVPLHQHK